MQKYLELYCLDSSADLQDQTALKQVHTESLSIQLLKT